MNPNDIPNQAQFGQLVSWLGKNGMNPSEILQAVGIKPNGRTRAEIADDLTLWIRNRV